MLTNIEKQELNIFAAEVRKETIKALTTAGGGHVGGAMSMVEALAVLYAKVMNVDPKNPRAEERDRFVLSKGHAGPSLYATLACRGFFEKEVLQTINKGETVLPSHCDRNKTVGVDFSTGSLGQGISMAAGSAVGAKYMGKGYYTYCIVGDGECDEGQVWETALFAAQHKLDNLVVFIDYNKKQLDGTVEEVCTLGNIEQKFREFGWYAQTVNGHDVEAIYDAVMSAKEVQGKPKCIVLDTEKGHGCNFAVAMKNCHHIVIPPEICQEEVERLDKEIEQLRGEV